MTHVAVVNNRGSPFTPSLQANPIQALRAIDSINLFILDAGN